MSGCALALFPVFSAVSAMPVPDALILLHRVLQGAPQRIGAAEPFDFALTITAKPFDTPLAGSFAIFKELGYVRHSWSSNALTTLFRFVWSALMRARVGMPEALAPASFNDLQIQSVSTEKTLVCIP